VAGHAKEIEQLYKLLKDYQTERDALLVENEAQAKEIERLRETIAEYEGTDIAKARFHMREARTERDTLAAELEEAKKHLRLEKTVTSELNKKLKRILRERKR